MDPESSVIDLKDSSEMPVKDSDSSEKPSLSNPSPAVAVAAKDFLETPSVAEKDGGLSLKVPITPALIREVDAGRADPVASPEPEPENPGLKMEVESGGEDSADGLKMEVESGGEDSADGLKMEVEIGGEDSADGLKMEVESGGEDSTDGLKMEVEIGGEDSADGLKMEVEIGGEDSAADGLKMEVESGGEDSVADGLKMEVESGGEDSADGCSTPKRDVFDSIGSESDEDDGDGCLTPKARVFDAFAPCKICPPTPGPAIPQRIRLF